EIEFLVWFVSYYNMVHLGQQLSRKPVDTTGSGATTSAIGAMTSRVGKSTLGGGFGMSPELIVAGVIS
ncbi:hypothetical protein Tco_1399650, partial [Tanacetum coccineum]